MAEEIILLMVACYWSPNSLSSLLAKMPRKQETLEAYSRFASFDPVRHVKRGADATVNAYQSVGLLSFKSRIGTQIYPIRLCSTKLSAS